MNIVDQIYNLIKNDSSSDTYNNNKELFQQFFYHYMSIRYNGNKVIEIYDYLLSIGIDDEHEHLPYFKTRVFEDLNRYELTLTQSVYSQDIKVNDDYVDIIFSFIDTYNTFKKYDSNNQMISYNELIRDITGSMIIILNKNFFELSIDNIKRMIDTIKNNQYLQNIISDKRGNGLLDKDYIFQYVSKFLFTKEFINYDNLSDEMLLAALKNGKIKNKDTVKRILKSIDMQHFHSIFNCDMSNFIDMLENTFEDELNRIEIFYIIYNKAKDKKIYRLLFKFIVEDERYMQYLNKQDIDKIIKNVYLEDFQSDFSDKEINYLLDNVDDIVFYINLIENLKENDWEISTVDRIINIKNKEAVDIIDMNYDEAINILDLIFKGKKESSFVLFNAIKRIIKEYLNDENIKIYLVDNDEYNGCAIDKTNSIKLNLKMISKLSKCNDIEKNPEAMHILNTMYHEARHIVQFRNMEKEDVTNDIYEEYKEIVLENLNSSYYTTNYFGVTYEIDARVTGATELVKLLKHNFPYLENCIIHYQNEIEKNETKDYGNKKIFELSGNVTINDALDRLVAINPSILKKYSLLTKDYNLDGTRKVSESLYK